jgi:hypothetical protein
VPVFSAWFAWCVPCLSLWRRTVGTTRCVFTALSRRGMRAFPSQVGTSKRLYLSIVSLCRKQYAEHGTVAVCSLRSQLLMALHDAAAAGGAAGAGSALSEISETDKCHRLASLLDACVKVRQSSPHFVPIHTGWLWALTPLPPLHTLRMATATTNG